MKLQDALDNVKSLSDDKVIFARKPWTLESEADVGLLDFEFRVPVEVTNNGLDYFLEVSVANDVLEVFGDRQPSVDEQRALLMYYAENDAYPKWVYHSE
ncbi:DUF7716 domain-containing protein [Massilia rhizosphaerae]|uniref:DUF7716 domain-containing protein n=1 Tax=Massilia rhizosphaerae TaxID=2784389 RepID=UPI0018DE2803|nr:hypothetical protein [Massilia rhizosphaerae]